MWIPDYVLCLKRDGWITRARPGSSGGQEGSGPRAAVGGDSQQFVTERSIVGVLILCVCFLNSSTFTDPDQSSSETSCIKTQLIPVFVILDYRPSYWDYIQRIKHINSWFESEPLQTADQISLTLLFNILFSLMHYLVWYLCSVDVL